jgi:carbamoyltransferase
LKVVGLYNWHDGGYCVLEDGIVKEHIEIERYTRLKEDGGDSLKYLRDIYLKKNNLKIEDINAWVSPCPNTNLEKGGGQSFDTHNYLDKSKVNFYSHHLCHASHAFFSSDLKDSLVLTIDSAGLEENGNSVSTCGYLGNDNKIEKFFEISNNKFSLGSLWGRCTRFIFKLSSGYPRGHQAGSVMAMAAFGDPTKYYDDFMKMATVDFPYVTQTPPGYKRGVYVPPEEDVTHPYLDRFRKLAEIDEQTKMDLAASLQKVTEELLFNIIKQAIQLAKSRNNSGFKNICLAGGVSLNSSFAGKIIKHFKGDIEKVFIPPVPYDGGLSIGAAQYHWHVVLGNARDYNNFVSPYLGESYGEIDVRNAIKENESKVKIQEGVTIEDCADLLVSNNIISIFQGRSESGRRALGNRSIVANPISENMKEMINKKVKHRQWFRPFAPSVLEEYGHDWFEDYFESPYMGFVFKFKDEMLGKVPAVEHKDKTARIQTVNKLQNKNYYNLIKSFFNKTGVPIILNTSFNDREPIVETPRHAINCFLGTNIDYLYFLDHNILISKINE